MKIINLKKTSGNTVQKFIEEYCGGESDKPFWKFPKNNIAGLRFCDPSYRMDIPTHLVMISLLNTGMGIYFRNIENSKLILLPYHQIQSIVVMKPSDVIRPFRFSVFSMLIKSGVHFNIAKKFLMPKEYIKEVPGTCTITTDTQYFKFIIYKINPTKLSEILQQSRIADVLHVSIDAPVILDDTLRVKQKYE